jgi:hypothetical protein
MDGCTTTCVAVMVVLLVVPSTSTGAPVVTGLAAAALVPFWYVVDGTSTTVTLWPVEVDIVKPVVDIVPTVPIAPPAAGADRAFDAPPAPNPPAAAGAGAALLAVAADDVVRPADTPITAHTNAAAAATIHRRLLLHKLLMIALRLSVIRRACQRFVCAAWGPPVSRP